MHSVLMYIVLIGLKVLCQSDFIFSFYSFYFCATVQRWQMCYSFSLLILFLSVVRFIFFIHPFPFISLQSSYWSGLLTLYIYFFYFYSPNFICDFLFLCRIYKNRHAQLLDAGSSIPY